MKTSTKLATIVSVLAVVTGVLAHIGSMAVIASGFIFSMVVITSPLIYALLEKEKVND